MKTALVTGGTRGIGLGIAKALASDGIKLALNGMRPVEQVREVLTMLQEISQQPVIYCPGNIGVAKDRKKILNAVYTQFADLNFLINNAGVAPRQRMDLLEMTEESFDRVMGINLKGPFFLSQMVAKRMVRARKINPLVDYGIINVSSISATIASPERGQYCISKAGIGMMTQLFATRLGKDGIPVYEIRPGIIATDMTSGVTEKYDKLIEDGLCIQERWGMPEDVGKATAALVNGYLPYSTGQIIMVDGGLSIQRL